MADKLSNKMRLGYRMKIANVIQSVKKNYMADISVTKAYWEGRKAMEKLQGKAIVQYSNIWDYCEEVRRINPGSSLQVKVDRSSLTH